MAVVTVLLLLLLLVLYRRRVGSLQGLDAETTSAAVRAAAAPAAPASGLPPELAQGGRGSERRSARKLVSSRRVIQCRSCLVFVIVQIGALGGASILSFCNGYLLLYQVQV